MAPSELVEHLAALHSLAASPSTVRTTDVVAALLPVLRRVSPATLKASQRETEEALLKVLLSPPGVPPLQRGLLADALAAVFARGSAMAVFSRVSELSAVLDAKERKGGPPIDVQLGALTALSTLAQSLTTHLGGTAGRTIVACVPKACASGEAAVRCAGLALLGAFAATAAALPFSAAEAGLKAVKSGASDKDRVVRSAAYGALACFTPPSLFAADKDKDKPPKADAWADAVVLACAGLKDGDKGVRGSAAAALGALAAAAMLPPPSVAAAAAPTSPKAKTEASRAKLRKALDGAQEAALAAPFLGARTRPSRAAAACAWVSAARLLSSRGCEEGALVALGVATLSLLPRLAASPSKPGDEPGREAHGVACVVHVLAAVGACRGEPLRRALLAAITERLSVPQPHPLTLLAGLRAVGGLVTSLGEVSGEEALATGAPLVTALLAPPSQLVAAEAATAMLRLARVHPATGARACKDALNSLAATDVRALPASEAASAQLAGHASVLAALAGGEALGGEGGDRVEAVALLCVDSRAPPAKQAGWSLLAAVLAGDGGDRACERHGATLTALWSLAFAREALLGPKNELRSPDAAPAELMWRASAAEALGAALATAVGRGGECAASVSRSLAKPLKEALVLAAHPALACGDGTSHALAHAAQLFRLRVLEACACLPSASLYGPLLQEALAAAQPCLGPGAAPARDLLLSLLEGGDASLGPAPPEAEEATAQLLRFGGSPLEEAPPPRAWAPPDSPFPAPVSCAVALASASCAEYGRLWAATHPQARTQLMKIATATVRAGYAASKESAARGEGHAGGSDAAVNAAAAALCALAAASAPRGYRHAPLSVDDADCCEELGRALAADPAPGAALLRASAQLRAAAARARGASADAAVLEVVKSLKSEGRGPQRWATVLSIGACFRACGGMALSRAIAPAVSALTLHPAEGPEILWVAHALGLVASASGAAFSRHAPAAVDGALTLLSADAAQQPGLGAACGRIVNAAAGALGPGLADGGGVLLRRAQLLVQHARLMDGPEPGAALEDILFIQNLALFAPTALDLDDVLPRLMAALASRSRPLRCAAAALCRSLADSRGDALRSGGAQWALYALLDASDTASAEASDATAALTSLAWSQAGDDPLAAMKAAARTALGAGDDHTAPTRGNGDAGDDRAAEGGDGDGGDGGATPQGTGGSAPPPPTARAAWLPGLHARAAASRLLASLPEAVPADASQHWDLGAARSHPGGAGMALHLQAAVDLGYTVATGPETGLRPLGLLFLRRCVSSFARIADADDPHGGLLLAQCAAQVLSALRAALAPSSPAVCVAGGAALAAAWVASGLAAADAAVETRVLTLLCASAVALADAHPGSEEAMARCGVLAAHASIAAAPSKMAASLQAAHAPLLRSSWGALLRDAAQSVGLADPPQQGGAALSPQSQPRARAPTATALLAWCVPAVVVALCGSAAEEDAPSTALLHSLALWALTPDAAAHGDAAFRAAPDACVWGATPGGADVAQRILPALASLLPPSRAVAPDALAEVVTALALMAAHPTSSPALAAGAPQLVARLAAATARAPPAAPHLPLLRACAAVARAAVSRALSAPPSARAAAAQAASLSLDSLRSLVAALPPSLPPPLAAFPAACVSLARCAVSAAAAEEHPQLVEAAAQLIAAAAPRCTAAQRDDAAECITAAAACCADMEEPAGARRLEGLLRCASVLGAASAPGGVASRRCCDAFAVVVDEEAKPPPACATVALNTWAREGTAPATPWTAALCAALADPAADCARAGVKKSKQKGKAGVLLAAALNALAAALPHVEPRGVDAMLATLVPVAVAAAAPAGDTVAEPAVAAAALAFLTAAAGAAPDAFKTITAQMEPADKARLQAALRAPQAHEPVGKTLPTSRPTTAAAKPGAIQLGAFKARKERSSAQ